VGLNYGPDPRGTFSEILFVVDASGQRILFVEEDGDSGSFGGGSAGGGGAGGKWIMVDPASITASATLSPSAYPTARRGGLRGAGGISTDARIAANIERGF